MRTRGEDELPDGHAA